MKIVVLDGYALNPGNLSWDSLKILGDLRVYDRTPEAAVAGRIGDAAIILTSKIPIAIETLVVCPHIFWAPRESRQRLLDIAIDNLIHFINGDVRNQVNRLDVKLKNQALFGLYETAPGFWKENE